MASPSSQDAIDTAHSLLWHLDLDKVYGLKDARRCKKRSSEEYTPSCWDDLPTATMNGISMESNIHDVKANRAHRLFGDRTFSCSPLEAGNDRIFDFIEILDGFGLVN